MERTNYYFDLAKVITTCKHGVFDSSGKCTTWYLSKQCGRSISQKMCVSLMHIAAAKFKVRNVQKMSL